MSATILSGPCITSGAMTAIPGIVNEYNPDAGPSITYQGDSIPDVRYTLNKDNILPGTVRTHMNYAYFLSVDAVPSALTTAGIAALQNVTSGTAMTLAAASTGIATNIPIYPFQSGALVNANIALDFGFDTLNVTSGSVNATVADSTKYSIGMPLVVANVGNSGGTAALLCFVKSITSSTVIVLSTPALATNAAAAVGTGNMWGPQGLSNVQPTAAQPYLAAGAGLFQDPYQSLTRGLQIFGSASATGGNFLITGYDLYGRLQTQLLTHPGGAVAAWTKKTFKYIQSIVPQFTDAHNYSVGTSDVFGVAIRNDKWEYDNFYWAGAFLTASTGWTAADKTSPATTTTGDVRGTIQIGTNGPLGSGASGGASNGTLRLALFSSLPFYNATQATPQNPVPMYGVTPV